MRHELRHAMRSLLRTPGLTWAAVLNLGLGIAAVTFTFCLTYGMVVRGLPVPGGDRIYRLYQTLPARGVRQMDVSLHDFLAWRSDLTSFHDLGAAVTAPVNVSGTGHAERYEGASVTPNTFRILRTEPVLGRSFTEEESRPGSPDVAVLAYHVWRDRFDLDPRVLGGSIRVDGRPATVVGVMPEGFRFPRAHDLWLPLRMDPLEVERGQGPRLTVYGRLKDEVRPEAAQRELLGVSRRLAQAYPETNGEVGVSLQPYAQGFLGPGGDALMAAFLVVLSLVLIIACVNVANLLLARTLTREGELAIATALGAGRRRIFLRLLAESGMLAGAGALLGILLAWLALLLFRPSVEASNPPFWFVFTIDWPVLLFVASVFVAVTLMAGILPGIRAAGTQPGEAIRREAGGSRSARAGRLSRALVVGELALSLGLLMTAGLAARAIVKVKMVDLPFSDEAVLNARLGLSPGELMDPQALVRFYQELVESVEESPRAAAVSLATAVPGIYNGVTTVEVEGWEPPGEGGPPRVRNSLVSPGFFATLEVALDEGREFRWSDDSGAPPVAIVNRSFARRYFPGESAVGRRLRITRGGGPGEWLTIVGLAPDLMMQGMQMIQADGAGFYRPLSQVPARTFSILARSHPGRSTGDPLTLAPVIRERLRTLSPDTPIFYVDTMRRNILTTLWQVNVFGTVFIVFGLVALALATVGLYGIISFNTRTRTREIGIRMALGAREGRVAGMIVRQGLWQLLLGLLLGFGLALLITRGMQSWFFQVSHRDPLVFVLVPLVMLVTGVVAIALPARRAAAAEPARILRED